MSKPDYIFTSESVSEGHPDKVCDRISDEILDLYLTRDPAAKVAVETLATTNTIVIAGEMNSSAEISVKEIEDRVRDAVKDIGYTQDTFHWDTLKIINLLHAQSSDIAMGVDDVVDGAGDQGIMFGYACNETPVLMPAAIYYSHAILKALALARHSGVIKELGPDAKSQISLLYVEDKPVKATSIVVSSQHREDVQQDRVREIMREYVLKVLPPDWMCDEDYFYVNPTGRFVIGGPDGDTGLTGRKIIVDTYGGAAPHGGGAFSGKDPSKVDRSAAYMARYLAKNIVGANLAEECTIQLSYAIGIANPTSLYVNLHGTGVVDEQTLVKFLSERIDLTPKGIREYLQLRRPIYARTSAYGHFGREPDVDGGFSWEKLDLVDDLRSYYSE
jgi:S-adenosylmethionine synthetase